MRLVIRFLYVAGLTNLSCSSWQQRAEDHMLKREPTAAEAIYIEVLASSPNNSIAQVGLQRARNEIVADELIDIRKARLSGANDLALTMLMAVYSKEQKWGMSSQGVTFSTQLEEINEAYRYFEGLVNEGLKQGFPVVARIAFEKHEGFFIQTSKATSLSNLRNRIWSAGNKTCQSWKQSISSETPNFGAFLRNYCRYWGVEESRTIASLQFDFEKTLYKSVELIGRINNTNKDIVDYLRQELQKGLENTVWFSAKGEKTLVLSISGSFSEKFRETPATLEHSFTTSEPYSAFQTQVAYRSEPYQACTNMFGMIVPYNTLMCPNQYPFTAYREVPYYQQVPVTKYRDVPMVHRFKGIEYQQTLALSINLVGHLFGTPLKLVLNESENENGTFHNTSMPEIGLAPAPNKGIDKIIWLKSNVESLSTNFEASLIKKWAQINCADTGRKPAEVAEAVLRCIKGSSAEYDFVDLWYKKNFGISSSTVRTLFLDTKT